MVVPTKQALRDCLANESIWRVNFLKFFLGKLVRHAACIRFSAFFYSFWAETEVENILKFWWHQCKFSSFLIFSIDRSRGERERERVRKLRAGPSKQLWPYYFHNFNHFPSNSPEVRSMTSVWKRETQVAWELDNFRDLLKENLRTQTEVYKAHNIRLGFYWINSCIGPTDHLKIGWVPFFIFCHLNFLFSRSSPFLKKTKINEFLSFYLPNFWRGILLQPLCQIIIRKKKNSTS